METKKCKYCKGEIIGKREDAKFCSNTCKAKYWEEKKHLNKTTLPVQVQEENNVTSQLRGVMNNDNANNVTATNNTNETISKTVEVPIYNSARFPIEKEIRRLTNVRMQLVSEVMGFQNKLNQIKLQNGNTWLVGLTGAGALIGNETKNNKSQGTLLGGVVGLIAGSIIKNATKDIRENDKKQQSEIIMDEINKRVTLKQDNEKAIKSMEEKLKTMPRFLTVQKQISVVAQSEIKANNPTCITTLKEITKPLIGLQRDVSDVSLTDINSDKIISSQQLNKMQFKSLNFQEKWNSFFGYPSINFHCVIFGLPGGGKSNFAIKFAKYLADKIGRVIYISSEEGLSKTLKEKFLLNNRYYIS